MRKKAIVILIVVLSVFVLAYTVNANVDDTVNSHNTIDRAFLLLNQQSFDQAREKTEIQDVLDKKFPEIKELLKQNHRDFNIDNESNMPVKYGEPYKVYKIKNAFINDNESIEKCIDSSSYFWEVPLFDGNEEITNALIIDKVKGKWKVVDIGLRFSPKVYSSFCNNEIIFKNIASVHEIKEISQMVRVSDLVYYNGIFVKSGKNEYMLPYTSRPDLLKLENGKLYSVKQVATKVNDMIKQFEIKVYDH
ncbi:MAG TPA: hypothetical protein DD421_02355 [Clostridiaceae bacterium]|jgi:hypothetical protein|nr:hypothetical protein [Clostridiaceae bacterium]